MLEWRRVFEIRAAPMELKRVMEQRPFYKHVAPTELGRGCMSVKYPG